MRELSSQSSFFQSKNFKGSAFAFYVLTRFQKFPGDYLLSVSSEEEARRLAQDLKSLSASRIRVLLYPPYDRLDSEILPPNALTVHERLRCLQELSESREPILLVSTDEALLQGTIPAPRLKQLRLNLKEQTDWDMDKLCQRLTQIGYRRDEMVASRGEFSRRGDILDVFPSTQEQPVRIEFFGDTIESIRSFDPYSQRSQESLENVSLYPVQEFDAQSFEWNGDFPQEYRDFFSRESFESPQELASTDCSGLEWLNALQKKPCTLESYRSRWQKPVRRNPGIGFSPVGTFGKNMELFLETIHSRLENGYQVLLFFPRKGFAARIEALLKKWKPRYQKTFEAILKSSSRLVLADHSLHAGFECEEAGLSVLTHADFTGAVYQPSAKKATDSVFEGEVLNHFSELAEGDYVIHVDHGVACFQGLETVLIEGIQKEYLKLQYQGSDRVLVPITDVDRVFRHTPVDGRVPKLNKLNSIRWSQVKGRAREEIEKFAKELLEHYARREMALGHGFSRDNDKVEALESGFEYDETRDQLKAIQEIKQDMENREPMDRLLCGDVGYGKTEVSIRAAFKALQDECQVAVLCPTTILAQQHFQTFASRLLGTSARVRVLNRFIGTAETRQTLKAVAAGEVDILIGTHRLLSKDVRFLNLGLLIVDEEQRFGVKHKEKLKELKRGVDTLAMSATPIPRSLHMSLSGARNISVIHTPPSGRLPVKTYVLPWQESTIRAAMERELRRGGQIFYVYNRVETIASKANQLIGLVPGIRLRYLHGQMDAAQIEEVMSSFLRREFDVLLATTIIESGMDIPNVNTILVDQADHFGLAQLYQLRGRIGRRDQQGYAYLFYREESSLTATARRRLSALEEFTDLGSGFKIAMRDLEIRGAGSILGKSQSGHVHQIGFDLYARLLRDAIERLKDGTYREDRGMPKLELRVSAYLSSDYIPSYRQRMDFFRRISWLRSVDELEGVRRELFDRYGAFPSEMNQLFELVRLRIQAHAYGVRRIQQNGSRVHIDFYEPLREEVYCQAQSLVGSGAMRSERFSERLSLNLKSAHANEHLRVLLNLFSPDI